VHSDLARFNGFGFWQRNGQDPLVDICADIRRIDRWIELVDATEIVQTDLAIEQFTNPLARFEDAKIFTIAQKDLKDGLKKTSYAISVDETRYVTKRYPVFL
jgi:hypothetical protein